MAAHLTKGPRMIFSNRKNQIYRRLFQRMLFATLFAFMLILAVIVFFELRQIKKELINQAITGSLYYQPSYLRYLQSLGEHGVSQLKKEATLLNFNSPELYLQYRNATGEHILEISSDQGDRINELFRKKYPAQDYINDDGVILLNNWRLYISVSSPILSPETNQLVGFVDSIRLLSPLATKRLFNESLTTIGLHLFAALLCGIICFFGFSLLNRKIINTIHQLGKANAFLLKKLGGALSAIHSGSVYHNHRVLIYAVALGEEVGISRLEMRALIMGTFLHDLEMLKIDSPILLARTTLDDETHTQIKTHPQDGYLQIKRFGWLRPAGEVIKYHHEHYNGSGYPTGVTHEKIPLTARIFSIADTFDALTSERAYRNPLEVDGALAELQLHSGNQFDPLLLSAFIKIGVDIHGTVSELSPDGFEQELNRITKKYLNW